MRFFINCIYKKELLNDYHYITIKSLVKNIKNEFLTIYLIIIKNSNFNIKFNEDYDIIYNSDNVDIEELINEKRELMSDIIQITDTDIQLEPIQQVILEKEYKKYKDGIYMKRKLNGSFIYILEIKKICKDGLHLNDEREFTELMNTIHNKYGIQEKIPSKHAILALIGRNGFILRNRGIYLPEEYSAKIPDDLLNDIIDFAINNKSIIYYCTIFEKFKNRLIKIGIDNHYYLKGCIDKRLPKELTTKRDYIKIGNIDANCETAINKEIMEFGGLFSISDLKKKFEGVREYVLNNYISKAEKNGLIKVTQDQYIHIDKLHIGKDTVEQLKEYINSLFIQFNTKVLSSRKIYSKMKIFNKPLFDKINLTGGQTELFSIIKYLYCNEYYYSRPLISIEADFAKSSYLLIKEYARTFDIFNLNKLQDYVDNMNITGLYSYLTFMEDMSDEYVQINIDTMIKKEKINISEDQIETIRKLIKISLNALKSIDTRMFNGYIMFPSIGITWSKYLLVGIIRSYMSEEFEIENIEGITYKQVDYIIKGARKNG